MRYLLLLLSLTLCFGVWAQDRVYKRVNPDGSVEYSDRPLEDAEVIKVPKGSTFTMPATSPARKAPPRRSSSADDVESYESLEITSPKNDEAIRSNDGRVTALAKSDPTLREGHRFRWSMDGTILPRKLKDPILLMKEVDRGTHSLEVAIIDGEGKVVISSQKITFHLLRASVN